MLVLAIFASSRRSKDFDLLNKITYLNGEIKDTWKCFRGCNLSVLFLGLRFLFYRLVVNEAVSPNHQLAVLQPDSDPEKY